jgi:RNA polymerase sigma-70 factor (ECF subfamily)
VNKPLPDPSKTVGQDGIDLDLVQRLASKAKAGDQAAFGELVKMYHSRVYGLMYRMVGQADDARDLEQQTWVKAWTRLASYKEEARFYTWLYRVAANTAMDFLRQRKRQQEVELNEDIKLEARPEVDRAFSVNAAPDEALAQDEIRTTFLKALEGLTPEHKAALILREVEGRSYKEIAEAMKCRVGTVMSRIFYARKTIQEKMKGLR